MIDILKPLNVLVQGITGSQGRFHTREMLRAGTKIVAGTSPNKAGEKVSGVPVFANICDAKKVYRIDASVVFVPAPFAKNALIEAIENDIKLIVCITEGIPTHDFLVAKKLADKCGATIVGPNCPGLLVPGLNKLGIIPESVALSGNVAIISRSGTLTYEAACSLSSANIGQRYIIGIGGDSVKGSSFVDWLRIFENDPKVSRIVLIGEIGSHDEQIAARFIAKSITKPVFAYIAGRYAPIGKQLGHAGAIIGAGDETAEAKSATLMKNGVFSELSIHSLVEKIKNG